MRYTKEQTTGFLGSAFFCMLLLLVLFFAVIRTEIKAGEEGILVNFGNVDLSSGTFEPKYQGEDREVPQEETAPAAPPVEQIPQTQKTPPVITQESEQTVAIAASKKKEEQEKQEKIRIETEKKRVADAQRKQAEDEQRKRDAINRQVTGAFGTGTSDRSQEGTGQSGTGNQGSSQGNAATGVYTGVGGYGEFNLGGRSLGSGGLPKPAYSIQEEGRIVVDITVNSKGNVIYAEIGKGTNIDNASMRKSALDAARKATFNSVANNNNQSGTITYKYSLR